MPSYAYKAAYNQIAQVYKTTSAVQSYRRQRMQGMDVMKYRLSAFWQRDYQIAKQAVTEAKSNIREDKVVELKAKVNSGNYFVDTADFAKNYWKKYNTSLM